MTARRDAYGLAGHCRRRAFLVSAAASCGVVVAPAHVGAAELSFDAFLADMGAKAVAQGVAPRSVDTAFAGLRVDPDVVALDRRQPEGRISFRTYRERVVNQARIDGARRRYAEHRALLKSIGGTFGVSPRVIVALWGIESSFGGFTGDYPVVRSLASLAYDGRRRELFSRELLAALHVLDRTPLQLRNMTGSWAGAMGQSQFLPSTYLDHAIDYDGDGWADIWASLPDVFASMANYLRSIGWNGEYRWGRQVTRTGGFVGLPTGRDDKRPLGYWAEAGVRRADGGALPVVDLPAGLIVTDDGAGPAYLVYGNFDVLMRWNRSTYFALSVGLLSDTIRT